MSEAPAETAETATPAEAPPAEQSVEQGNPATTDELGDAGKKAIDRMKAEKADAVKQMKQLQRELEQYKQASMSEAEKAVAEAESRGRQTATAEFGKRLARAQFDALAAKRNPDADVNKIVEFVDMTRFLGDDGEVDPKALQAAVDQLVPAQPAGPPSFDGGVRRPADPAADMNKLMRGALGRT